MRPRLIAERGADPHFLAEAVGSVRAVVARRSWWEPSVWIGYDSCSLLPFGVGFGRPLDASDENSAPHLELDPRALSPSAGVAGEDWTPQRWRV